VQEGRAVPIELLELMVLVVPLVLGALVELAVQPA
jgi:hypothetical protein